MGDLGNKLALTIERDIVKPMGALLDLTGLIWVLLGSMTLCGDDGFEVVPLPAFLLAGAVATFGGGSGGSGRDLLGLVLDSLLDVGAIHHGEGGGRVGPVVSG